ncbi:PTPLA-domain-containing protein [Multifurca ochricompacta]|uniref:Very-long-chain (3R)-3-hydroxyacyl-CoA dehydratase n=1 Tax=Multifurca ochricompacta TaxID=376703 RepID=A0AAD4LYS4_9AGAM|nr:PTPLA-domain-containing protein [Multifurca ochricompacta]
MSSQSRHQNKKKEAAASDKSLIIKAYLLTYNILSAAGWSFILYHTLAHIFSFPVSSPSLFANINARVVGVIGGGGLGGLGGLLQPPFVWVPSFVPAHLTPFYRRACTTYDAVGGTTALVQTAATLEVLHVLFGLVRSSLSTTTIQVASRLFSVWAIAAGFSSAQRSPFYATMVLSWALTEVIRYTFYATSLLGWEPAPLLWARYSTFYLLYPTGAGSEALVNLATLPISFASGSSSSSNTWFWILPFAQWNTYTLFRGALFVIWWPGLYPMYTHMIKQRRKVFGGQRLGAKPKTH